MPTVHALTHVVAEGVAACDRMLAQIDAIEAERDAKLRALVQQPKTAPEQLPLALTDASDIFGDDKPVWMSAAIERNPAAEAAMRLIGIDPESLLATNPAAYLAAEMAFQAGLRNAAVRPYVAQPGAGKALRHSLHETGVL